MHCQSELLHQSEESTHYSSAIQEICRQKWQQKWTERGSYSTYPSLSSQSPPFSPYLPIPKPVQRLRHATPAKHRTDHGHRSKRAKVIISLWNFMDIFTSIYAYCNYLIHYKECGSYSMGQKSTPTCMYMYMLQLIFFISVHFCFSFVLNSLAYITIPQNNGKMKIHWKKLTTTSFCYNIYKIYIKTLKLAILPLMNALYRFTQLTDSVTTFISFQHDSSCLHLLIHTGFLGWVIQMNQLQIHINTTRPHRHIGSW